MADTHAPVINEKSTKNEHGVDSHSIHKVDSVSDADTFIQGSEGVTQRDMETYRHVADSLPWGAWMVAIVEFAER
jgi:POT family proton-dependent oligopeptide transporter